MSQTLQNTLTTAGFEPIVAEIYLILVNNGELTVPQILEHTELSRASVYEALPELLAGEYIEYRKEGRQAFYKPAHPNQLNSLVEQKKREVALLEGEMGETIRSLVGAYNLSGSKPGIRFFEGEECMKEMYEDTLLEKKPLFAMLSAAPVKKNLRNWLNNTYAPKRKKAEIFAKVIVSDSPESQEYHTKDNDYLRASVLVAPDKFPITIEMNIYGEDKVAFMSFNESEMVGFIIQSPAIHKSMKTFFELAWITASAGTTPP